MQESNNTPEKTPYADLHFWAKYELYVKENQARHIKAVSRLLSGYSMCKTLDLGCGQVMEGFNFPHTGYVGVDKDIPEVPKGRVVLADYRTELDAIKSGLSTLQFAPDTVLSLFSIEPTGDDAQNEGLYQAIMIRFPTVRQIISAGFYYEDKEFDQWVTEEGGLRSHQTSQFTPLLKGNLKETRLYEHAPSTLFGDKVVEVWRLIERA